MGTARSRREKHIWLQDTLERFWRKHPKKSISKNLLVAEFVVQLFSAKETAEEILFAFETVGSIVIKGDEITKGANFE